MGPGILKRFLKVLWVASFIWPVALRSGPRGSLIPGSGLGFRVLGSLIPAPKPEEKETHTHRQQAQHAQAWVFWVLGFKVLRVSGFRV